jgi:hypothetical protein
MSRPAGETAPWHPDGPAARRAAGGAFFRAAREAFTRSVRAAGGPVERSFQVGGWRLRLRFAGPALVPALTAPLEHLASPAPGNPDLTVSLWDTSSTGVQPPSPPWPGDAYGTRGGIDHDLGDGVRAAFSIDSGILYLYDAAAGRALCWVRDPRGITPWEQAAPLRPLLGWWAAGRGGQLVHGAAVGLPGAAALLAARGNSGKSTTALACLEAGLLFLGDDYLLLRDDGGPSVHSLYSSAKLVPDHLRRALPGLEPAVARPGQSEGDKATLLLAPTHRTRLVDRLPLRAILVPRLAPAGRTALRRASAAQVLTALAPTTLFQLPGAGGEALRAMGHFARRVPGYALDVGADLQEVVRVIRRLLREGGAHAG